MKNRYYIIFVLFILTFISCKTSHKLTFYGETVDVNYPERVDTLKGYPVNFEGVYTGAMLAYDSILIFKSHKHPDAYLYAYNVETGKRINALCKRGNGTNEVLFVSAYNCFELDSTGVCLWVNDFNQYKLMLVNMRGDYIKQIKTSNLESTNPSGIIAGAFVLNDSLLTSYMPTGELFENQFIAPFFRLFNYRTNETLKDYLAYSNYEVDLKNYLADGIYPGSFLSSLAEIKPDKSKIAMAMWNLKRIDILDLKSGITKSIVPQDAQSLERVLLSNHERKYYSDIRCDDRYIYVVEGTWNDPSGRIFVLDWDGNFIRILQADEDGLRFTFDPVRKILYTKTDDERVTAYDLKFLYK